MGIINDVPKKLDLDDWTCIEDDPRTLKSCLRTFGLACLLQALDNNLEDVRKNKIKEDEHKSMIKEIDKKLLTLSLTHHPDRHFDDFNKRVAHNYQAIINATRTLLNRLSEDFLRNIEIDYKYEYYAYIDIGSIGTEEDVDKLNLNLQYQLIMLSEIKHEKIIANIKKFLMSCEACLDSYYNDDRRNFVLNFNLAINKLKECIKGYKVLTGEFTHVEKECAKNHKLQNTLWIVQKMAADFERQLKILEKIKHAGKQSLKGNFQFYAEEEIMDSYFVLPFAKYINILSMCNVMIGNTERSWLPSRNYKRYQHFPQFDGDDKEEKFLKAYYLASYFDNPSSSNEYDVQNKLNIRFNGDKLMSFCKNNFDCTLHSIRENLKEDFNVEKHYIVRSVRKRTEEYNKDVQDFFDRMQRRKKPYLLALMDDQEKIKIDEDFEGIVGEEELLKKIRENFKDRGEKLKTKVIQSEIMNEKLRVALDTNKKRETILVEKLGKFSSNDSEKLIDEILEREEENRKLENEIEKKREEERFLIFTLCENYEKISFLLKDKIIEVETKKSRGDAANENRSSENFVKTTGYQREKIDCEEGRDVEKSLTAGEENQNSMVGMERKRTDAENSEPGLEHQTSVRKIKGKIKSDTSKSDNQTTCQRVVAEESFQKSIRNEADNDETTIHGHLSEQQNKLAVQASEKDNSDLNILEHDVQKMKLAQELFQEKAILETSGNEIDKEMHERKECVKYQPKNAVFKTLFNQPVSRKDAVDNSDVQVKHREKTENAKVHGLQAECGHSNISKEKRKRRRCTYSFENGKIKEVLSIVLTKSKSIINIDNEDEEVNNINKLKFKRYEDEKASQFDTEKETSFEAFQAEQEKGREVIEALRNLNKVANCNISRRKT